MSVIPLFFADFNSYAVFLTESCPFTHNIYKKNIILHFIDVSFSFDKGEIFVVHNDMGDGWLWVTSQATGLSGIVYSELVQELVSYSVC